MKTTKITYNRGLNEYTVKFFIDGVYQSKADYYTDDKSDAEDTAEHFKSGSLVQ